MSAPAELRDLIERRRNLAMRHILDVCDDVIDPLRQPDEKAAIRKVVLDEFNDFTDVILGLIDRTSDEDHQYNIHALELIAAVYERVVGEPAPALNGTAAHAR